MPRQATTDRGASERTRGGLCDLCALCGESFFKPAKGKSFNHKEHKAHKETTFEDWRELFVTFVPFVVESFFKPARSKSFNHKEHKAHKEMLQVTE